jgi:hypothetical protein
MLLFLSTYWPLEAISRSTSLCCGGVWATRVTSSRYIETVPRRGYRFVGGVCEGWDGDGHALGETHTKVSLSVKEEIEEEDEGESLYDGNEKARVRNRIGSFSGWLC